MQKISIYDAIIFRTLLCSFIAILLTGVLLMWSKYSHLTVEFKQFRMNYINLQKENIRQEVDAAIQYIQHKQIHSYTDIGAKLEEHVYEAYQIAWNLYIEHPDLPATEFQKLLVDILRPVRLFRDRAYYFCLDNAGQVLLEPSLSNLDENAVGEQNAEDAIVIQNMLQTVRTQSEGFIHYNWRKLNTNQRYPKYAFIKIFEPFNMVLGVGEYSDNIEFNVQREILESLSNKRFGKHGENYLFVLSPEGTMLASGAQPHLVGKDATQLVDAHGKNFIKEMLQSLKTHPEGVFVDYVWAKPNRPAATPKILL
ncbi:MAG: cache domain-containing protein [Thiotrichaceae bacterium]